jgi:hypothetical protein
MAGDFNKPIVTDTYAMVLQAVRDVMADMAKGLDPALALGTANIPANTIRWNSASKRDEKFNGSVWAEKCASYAINIDGSAAKWTTGRTIQLTGAVTGTSGAWDGTANLSFITTLSTVTADKGGTGLTAYSIGDLIYASGAAALSKLSDVAAGNVLLSGGVGAAPGWGKVDLVQHINGILSVANGGTGNNTNTSAACSGTATYSNHFYSVSHAGTYYLDNNWDGVYWYVTSNHGAPVRVGYADYAASAGAAVDQAARNSAANAQNTANAALPATTEASYRFVSGLYPFPPINTDYAVAHGLGVIPTLVEVCMVCVQAEYGYSVGDEMPMVYSDGDAARWSTVYFNSSVIGFNTTNTGPAFKNRAGAGGVIGTNARWNIRFRAWR